MPETVAELTELLDLERIEVDLFRGRHPQTQLQRSFGGQVLAQALAAGYATVSPERTAHSLRANFLRPGRTTAPLIYEVENTREGRSFSSRRVLARQAGETIFAMSVSFHIDEPGLDHGDPMPADVPRPEDCPRLSDVLGARSGREAEAWRREWGALDVRHAGDSGPHGTIPTHSHRAHMRVWVRTSQALPDDPGLHQMILAYASDLTLLAVSTVPHGVHFGGPGMTAASLDHAMWFHRPARADKWWLYDQVSPSASKALGFSLGRIFADGRLAASCAQEGLIRLDPALLPA